MTPCPPFCLPLPSVVREAAREASAPVLAGRHRRTHVNELYVTEMMVPYKRLNTTRLDDARTLSYPHNWCVRERLSQRAAGVHTRAGLWRDMTKRLFPLWVDDFKDGVCSQVFATSLFMFVACLSTAATFGVGTAVLTNGAIGPLEMILSSSICGVIYALSCGQPVALPAFGGVHLGFTGVLFG